ncbi:MAG: phosphoglycerate kinase [Aureispira sp.]|nr:phosphoglycerate kinase [Aureispira sp.]
MSIEQLNLKGKKVLMRVDFNVPLDADFNVTDDTRIQAALPTIQHVLEQGASLIIMSHLGRPQKKLNEDGSINKTKFTLRHVVQPLSELINRPVQFVEDTVGKVVEAKAAALQVGEVLILENTRFYKEEKKGDEAFAKGMSVLADVYINDAFGTAHRAHASTATVAQYFDKENKSFGFLMNKELNNAKKLTENPARPFTAIIGGAKVSDKILLLEKLVDSVDNILIGGGMAYTLIKAKGGQIGNSLCEDDKLDVARALLAKAAEKGVEIYLPEDSVVANKFANDAEQKVVASDSIEEGWMGLDIGPKAVTAFVEVIRSAESMVWNGPMGVFEMDNFANGTKTVAEAVTESTKDGAFSLVGGGDSVAALNHLEKADEVSYVSTGGGAMLKLLEGSKLPGVEAILA